MGGCLYPESLVQNHTESLRQNIPGNAHSLSNTQVIHTSSYPERLCWFHPLDLNYRRDMLTKHVRLYHFKASSKYTVVFTPNASAALKLVGEAYPFTRDSCLVSVRTFYLCTTLPHQIWYKKVHGIRAFAAREGAKTVYIPSTPSGGFEAFRTEVRIFDFSVMTPLLMIHQEILIKHRPRSRDAAPSLFIMTGQSNVFNSKSPLYMITRSASLGYDTMMDAAALTPTCNFSLSEFPVDALLQDVWTSHWSWRFDREKILFEATPTAVVYWWNSRLCPSTWDSGNPRPQLTWTVWGKNNCEALPRQSDVFNKDSTVNYLHFSAIKDGLCFLSAYLPFLPLRLSSLLLHPLSALTQLRHDSTGNSVVRILSKLPSGRVKTVGEQSDVGSVMSLVFLGVDYSRTPTPDGHSPLHFFISKYHYVYSPWGKWCQILCSVCCFDETHLEISLRTGCMYNPGGVAAMLGPEEQGLMQQLLPGVTVHDVTEKMGPAGVVRIRLGLASNFQDVWKLVCTIRFANLQGNSCGVSGWNLVVSLHLGVVSNLWLCYCSLIISDVISISRQILDLGIAIVN